jgi:hypothetical protein
MVCIFLHSLLAFLLGSLPGHSYKSKGDGSGPVTDTSEPWALSSVDWLIRGIPLISHKRSVCCNFCVAVLFNMSIPLATRCVYMFCVSFKIYTAYIPKHR